MIRRALLFLACALAVWFGGRALYVALASPEKKIRWRMEEMVEGFDDMRMRPVLDGIAPGFVDRTSELTRDDLRQTFAWMFLNETDEHGGFLWRAELDPEALSIEVDSTQRTAAVSCRVQVFQRRGADFALAWDAHLTGKLARTDDGWQWTELTSANHAERKRR